MYEVKIYVIYQNFYFFINNETINRIHNLMCILKNDNHVISC